jgi:hypothetical protein
VRSKSAKTNRPKTSSGTARERRLPILANGLLWYGTIIAGLALRLRDTRRRTRATLQASRPARSGARQVQR